MPTFYVVRDAHKTRGPMDAASASVLLAERGAAGCEVAEVQSGAPGEKRVFVRAASHRLWTERDLPSTAPDAGPWLTTESAGWPDAQRLGIVGADRLGTFPDADRLRAEVLDALASAGAALDADAVVAVAVAVTGLGGGGLVVSATGTALRLA